MLKKLSTLTTLLTVFMFSCENNADVDSSKSLNQPIFTTPIADNVLGSSISVNPSGDEITLTFTPTDAGLGYARAKIKFDNGNLEWAQNDANTLKFPVSSGVSKTISFDRFYNGSSTFDVPDIAGSHTVYVEIWGVDVSGNSQQLWTSPILTKTYTNAALSTPVITSISEGQEELLGYYLPKVNWNIVSEADAYRIYRKTGVSGTYQLITTISNPSTTTFDDTNTKLMWEGPRDKNKSSINVYYKMTVLRYDVGQTGSSSYSSEKSYKGIDSFGGDDF